jgi:hypothetical protein
MKPAALLKDGTLLELSEGDFKRIMRRVVHEGGQLEGGLALDSGNILSMTGWSAILKDVQDVPEPASKVTEPAPEKEDLSGLRKSFKGKTGQHYDRVNKPDMAAMLETPPADLEAVTKPELAQMVIDA